MKPALLVRKGGELALSGESLTELLRAVLDKGRPFRFRALGWSMSPFIKDGDVVTVSPCRGRRLRTGAVVAFIHPETGKTAVHRIVRARGGHLVVKGDNCEAADGRVSPDRILGAVTRIERNGRKMRLGRGPADPIIAILSRSGWLGRAADAFRALFRRRPGGSP